MTSGRPVCSGVVLWGQLDWAENILLNPITSCCMLVPPEGLVSCMMFHQATHLQCGDVGAAAGAVHVLP